MFQTNVGEKIKTNILHSKVFPKIVPFFEIMWKIVVKTDRPQMT